MKNDRGKLDIVPTHHGVEHGIIEMTQGGIGRDAADHDVEAFGTQSVGKAARPATADDKHTLGIQEFNRLVYASKDLYPVLIPLRDGVTVCRKV